MRTSEHYELNLVEGTDKVNPLVQDVPNYERIDDAMYDNKCSSIGIATELRTGTVHALTRQNEDAPMFRFTASSNYTSGDTFTVDGVQVSALLVDGTPLPNMAYIIGSEVLCVLKGTLMTVFANRTTSSDSDRLGGELPSHYATDSDLDALEGVVDAHTKQISQINNDLSNKCPKGYTAYPSTSAGWSQCVSECEDIVVMVGFISEYNTPCLINIPIVASFVRGITSGTNDILIYDAQYKATLKVSATIFNPSFEINGTSVTAYYHIYGR